MYAALRVASHVDYRLVNFISLDVTVVSVAHTHTHQ